MDNVISAWMDTDKDSAIAYYQGLPSGDLRTNALRGVANSLALEDPVSAANFIDANAADANDRVYQQFVWHSFGEAPEIAANYIGHPLASAIPLTPDPVAARAALGLAAEGAVLAVLPGSRIAEIDHIAPAFLQARRVLARSGMTPQKLGHIRARQIGRAHV